MVCFIIFSCILIRYSSKPCLQRIAVLEKHLKTHLSKILHVLIEFRPVMFCGICVSLIVISGESTADISLIASKCMNTIFPAVIQT